MDVQLLMDRQLPYYYSLGICYYSPRLPIVLKPRYFETGERERFV
jgi:hypothetical protein